MSIGMLHLLQMLADSSLPCFCKSHLSDTIHTAWNYSPQHTLLLQLTLIQHHTQGMELQPTTHLVSATHLISNIIHRAWIYSPHHTLFLQLTFCPTSFTGHGSTAHNTPCLCNSFSSNVIHRAWIHSQQHTLFLGPASGLKPNYSGVAASVVLQQPRHALQRD